MLALHATFWKGNISLKEEMKRIASRLGRPMLLPTADELEEIDRKDLAMAIKHNGGIRKTAEMCGLRLPRASKRSEAPLRHVTEAKGFSPYPARRFEPKLRRHVQNWLIRFEVASDAKTGKGRVEEYGVWVANPETEALLGRFGWVRRRPGESDLWMHRLEGEAHWDGSFKDHSLEQALETVLNRCELGHGLPLSPESRRTHPRRG